MQSGDSESILVVLRSNGNVIAKRGKEKREEKKEEKREKKEKKKEEKKKGMTETGLWRLTTNKKNTFSRCTQSTALIR